MPDLSLPAAHLAILDALKRPAPRPRKDIDNPVEAIARRLPETPLEEVAHTIRVMNALGLTRIPYILGAVDPRVTQHPTDWITEEGWRALRRENGDPEQTFQETVDGDGAVEGVG